MDGPQIGQALRKARVRAIGAARASTEDNDASDPASPPL